MAKIKISKEARVGIFAIISLSVLYIGFNYLKGIEFLSSTNKYYAIYDNVAGLTDSNPVNINGFSVGRVSNVSILQNRGNKILVELDIEMDIILGEGTIALLQSDFLGSASILLKVGNIINPLQPGDTVLTEVETSLTDLLADRALPVADSLQITISGINAMLEDFASSSEDIKATIKNVRGITDKTNSILDTNQVNIDKTLNNFAIISDSLVQTLEKLSLILDNFGSVSDSLKNLELNATLARTNTLLDSMNKTFENLNDGTGTMGRLMQDDSVYINLNSMLANLDTLLVHMNENPKHFFGPLGKSRKKIEKDLAKQGNNQP